MNNKYLMFDLEDEKSRKLGEAISNPNCKKIINLLAEQELTASEISKKLKIKLNALDYNLKKLVGAGIIEKSKHFWSVKGKKIPTYRVVNKVIVIQPKKTSNSNVYSKLRGFIPAILVLALLTLVIAFQVNQQISSPSSYNGFEDSLKTAEFNSSSASESNSTDAIIVGLEIQESPSFFQPWMWFALGALLAIIIIIVVNWKRL
ncbi:MAG: winged helix-turn-helix domain-containing protein [Candidatus Pacearchaeota archaeon]|nr:winged helix-turn-helix domain-containing protein [Candidatus Pacearchaeota archaeon]